MTTARYRFGPFSLDPIARELQRAGERIDLPASTFDCMAYLIEHRARPVGRDELIAAVWGRAEVSETLLNHTILRLRRVLGDSARAQAYIRTAARYGYRWVADTTVEPAAGAAAAAPAAATEPAATVESATVPTPPTEADADTSAEAGARADAPRRRSRRIVAGLALIGLALATVLAAAAWWRTRPAAGDNTGAAPDALHVLVMPARIEAPPDWTWLRLGMMDLIAGHLRDGGLAVAPSETALQLARSEAGADMPSDANGWRLTPHIVRLDAAWQVTLTLAQPQGPLEAGGRADEVTAAVRQAADRLLAALGRAVPPQLGNASDIALQTLVQRAKAATLADQLDLARSLIEQAPPTLAQAPDLQWLMALIDSRTGRYDAARLRLERLLDGATLDPGLRVRTLNFLGSLYFRRSEYERARAIYEEAIVIAEATPTDAAARGLAYAGRGLVSLIEARYEDGSADLGRARVLYQAANNALGLAQVDMNLAGAAVLRGRPAAALPLLESAIGRFRTLASQEEYVVALAVLVDVRRALLDFDEALAVSERFWPAERHIANERLQWRLRLARAGALADRGRSAESRALAEAILAGALESDDEETRGRAHALLARLAFQHGACDEAAAQAAAAADNTPLRSDGSSVAAIALIRLRALRCAGRDDDAAAVYADLERREAALREPPARVLVALAAAEQARADGRTEPALAGFADAARLGADLAMPDLEVEIAASRLCTLLALGRLDEAAAVSGRIAPWADRDLRAAWAQALTHRALGRTDAWTASADQARRLAGERPLPDPRCP